MNRQTEQLQRTRLEVYAQNALEEFLSDCLIRHLAQGTVDFYRKKLTKFLEFCHAQAVTTLDHLDTPLMRQFFLWLETQGNSAGGVHAYYRALRAAFLWMEREYDGFTSPLRKVAAPKLNQPLIEGVSLAEVQALLATCSGETFTSLRDKALILVLMDTGVRVRELLSLRWEDIDLNSGTVIIRKGKNGKPRSAFLSRTTRKALLHYSRHCQTGGAVWVTKDGNPLSADALRWILRFRAKQAGLDNPPSPHDFRRAFALEMLRSGCDVFTLQRLMGHSDLSVLNRYLAQTQGDLQQAHAQFSPVERMKQGRATK